MMRAKVRVIARRSFSVTVYNTNEQHERSTSIVHAPLSDVMDIALRMVSHRPVVDPIVYALTV